MSKEPLDLDWRKKFERSQRRWGHLKHRILAEIDRLEHPPVSSPQIRHFNANSVARLKWVLGEMQKSPDVIAEAVKSPVWTDDDLEHALQIAVDYGFDAFKKVLFDRRS